MKRHLRTLALAMACMTLAVCASCKKDNHNDPIDGIAGLWSISSGTIDGHEYVDLGLPSGTLWATCNVGAKSPRDYGDYYAWGETKAKSEYVWRNYMWCKKSQSTLTKYNTDSRYGSVVDKKTVLDPQDDAAQVHWGGIWRMPTLDEMVELKEKCKWEWRGMDNSYLVIGPNGNSILLPAAGYRFGSNLNSENRWGFYWTSSLYSPISDNAYSLSFHSALTNPKQAYPRYRGHSVRPVCNPRLNKTKVTPDSN